METRMIVLPEGSPIENIVFLLLKLQDADSIPEVCTQTEYILTELKFMTRDKLVGLASHPFNEFSQELHDARAHSQGLT